MFVNSVTSCDECARQCNYYGRSCAAFECSATDLICAGLRSPGETLKMQYKDYQVCGKDLTGKGLLNPHMFSCFFDLRFYLRHDAVFTRFGCIRVMLSCLFAFRTPIRIFVLLHIRKPFMLFQNRRTSCASLFGNVQSNDFEFFLASPIPFYTKKSIKAVSLVRDRC